MLWPFFLLAALVAGCTSLPRQNSSRNVQKSDPLAEALTFYAPFDGRPDAIFAKGDPNIYSAPSIRGRETAAPGLPMNEVTRFARGEGKLGDALRFTRRQAPFVFFHAGTNLHYSSSDWSGTVSFWLNTDPANDLAPGFCDPIQITPRVWNDAAFFVEFEKGRTIPFRLGAYPDFKVWNPGNRDFDRIPASEKPLVTVSNPPFARGKWTHVAFTWENFNTGLANGVAKLYLDGEFRGEVGPRRQTFTWNVEEAVIGLGLNYIGLLDELAIFNRALTPQEIATVYRLDNGMRGLLSKR